MKWLAVVAMVACGPGLRDQNKNTLDLRHPRFDEFTAQLVEASSSGDVQGVRAMLRGSTVVGGLVFEDLECIKRFSFPAEVKGAALDELARCLTTLKLQKTERFDALPDVVVLTHVPGIELEARIIETGDGPWLTWIGFAARRDIKDAIPSITAGTLETLRTEGERHGIVGGPALVGDVAAGGFAYAWIKVCLDATGAITPQHRHREMEAVGNRSLVRGNVNVNAVTCDDVRPTCNTGCNPSSIAHNEGVLPHLLLPFLLVSSVVQQPTRPGEGKETAKTCTRWRGTASGNDRSVQLDVTLCEADGSVTGTLEWRSNRSGTSTRTLEGSRSGDVLVLRDVTLDGKPNAGWRFCKIDAYRLSRSGADALAGSYQSNGCHDHATLDLARVHRSKRRAELYTGAVDGVERTIVFGFPPTGERSEKRRATEDVANSLSERCGVRIAATFAADYRRLVDDLVAGRVDVAWLGPLGVLRAGAHAIPVLIMKRAGRTRYQSAWIARRDAGIASVADLARRCVGWVDEDSAAGYVFPRAVIAAHTADIDSFLGAQRILGSHRAVIEAVLNREVDAGATFVNYDDDGEIAAAGWYEHFPERKDELVPFATTSPIPHDMIAVRTSLPQHDRDAIVGALHALGSDHEGQDLRMAVFNGTQAFMSIEPSLLDELAQLGTRAGWPGLTST